MKYKMITAVNMLTRLPIAVCLLVFLSFIYVVNQYVPCLQRLIVLINMLVFFIVTVSVYENLTVDRVLNKV